MFKIKNGTKCYCDICGKEITDYRATENTFTLPLFTNDKETDRQLVKHSCTDLCQSCKRWLAFKIKSKTEDCNIEN